MLWPSTEPDAPLEPWTALEIGLTIWPKKNDHMPVYQAPSFIFMHRL